MNASARVAVAAKRCASAARRGGLHLDLGGGGGGWLGRRRPHRPAGRGRRGRGRGLDEGQSSSSESVRGWPASRGRPLDSGSGPGTIERVDQHVEGGACRTRGPLASVFAVTSFLAPLLEEVVFRGFLMASLTRWPLRPPARCLQLRRLRGRALRAEGFPAALRARDGAGVQLRADEEPAHAHVHPRDVERGGAGDRRRTRRHGKPGPYPGIRVTTRGDGGGLARAARGVR